VACDRQVNANPEWIIERSIIAMASHGSTHVSVSMPSRAPKVGGLAHRLEEEEVERARRNDDSDDSYYVRKSRMRGWNVCTALSISIFDTNGNGFVNSHI
jgi:hypothetical protein